jgi:ARC6-like, IMS domain
MNDEPTLITRLEDQIAGLHRDWEIAQAISKNTNPTAIGEYIALREDVRIILGIRYISLAAIAEEYQLYQDNREISQLKDLIGREIDLPSHIDTLYSIHTVRTKYRKVYELNYCEFDRIERIVKEISPELNEKGGNFPSSETDRHSKKDIKKTGEYKQVSNSNPTSLADSVFTNEQFQTILAAERARNFKSILIMIGMLLVGGGVGILIASRQQPQVIITSTPQSTAAPSNVVDSIPVVIATPSPPVSSEPVTPSPTAIENPSPQVSQDEAVSLVQKWLEAKKSLFAPQFDRDSAASITTGKAYTDKVRRPSSDGTPYSASEWLEKYGYYYSYGLQRFDRVNNFEVSGNEVVIDVTVTEDATLYNSKGERQTARSGLEQKTVRYVLVKDNGILKISDYNNLSSSSKRKI